MNKLDSVYIIDDEEVDILIAHANVTKLLPSVKVFTFSSAMTALKQIEAVLVEGRTLPELILLDINMPRLSGIEVLGHIKKDPALSAIPVIMLTTTDNPKEVDRCYELGCNVYITKPVEYDEFVEAVKRLGLFLQIVKPPRNGH